MTVAFDLVANPDHIQPAYLFYSVFWFASAVLAALTFFAFRYRWKMRWWLSVFAPVWIAGANWGAFVDARDVLDVRRSVELGAYTTVEGCLTSFHPGSEYASKSTTDDERWSVAGYDFAYGQGSVQPGYRLVEPRGGAVHRDSRVRVSFVRSRYYGRYEIVRLEVAEKACPPAPDLSGA